MNSHLLILQAEIVVGRRGKKCFDCVYAPSFVVMEAVKILFGTEILASFDLCVVKGMPNIFGVIYFNKTGGLR